MIIARYNNFMNNNGEGLRTTHFGKALKFYRGRAGLTQTELGARVKVGQSTIAGWEKQANPIDEPFMLAELARALRAPIENLEKGLIPNITPEEEEDEILALIKRLALYFGGPGADWRELATWVEAYKLMSTEERAREITYLEEKAARQHQGNQRIAENRADYGRFATET